MVNLDKLSTAELAELGVPTCCQGSSEIAAYVCGCCLLTVVVPLAVLFPLSAATPALKWVAVGLLAAGAASVLFSLRVTFWDGGLAMPPAPPLATSFVAAGEQSSSGGVNPLGSPQEASEAGGGRSKVKKVYVIVNPHGGLRKGPKALNEVVLPIWKNEFGIEATVGVVCAFYLSVSNKSLFTLFALGFCWSVVFVLQKRDREILRKMRFFIF
jgi:hypothetical protein